MSSDFKSIYEKQIKEIDKQLLVATKDKKWLELAKLESKKVDLQNKIKQIEDIHYERE
jgi:hypothetical protein